MTLYMGNFKNYYLGECHQLFLFALQEGGYLSDVDVDNDLPVLDQTVGEEKKLGKPCIVLF